MSEQNLGNISGIGCNTPKYDNWDLWRQVGVVGDRRSSGGEGRSPMGIDGGIDVLIDISDLFKVGIVWYRDC